MNQEVEIFVDGVLVALVEIDDDRNARFVQYKNGYDGTNPGIEQLLADNNIKQDGEPIL